MSDGIRSGIVSRRRLLGGGGAVAAALLAEASATPLAAASAEPSEQVYRALGVEPFINCTATVTINGGSRQLPEVIEAIEHAAHYHVNLDELMEAAGRRVADLLEVPWAMVSSGAAAALTHATAACVVGTDPERMLQLPDLRGLKDEVIMPAESRNAYDYAVRMVGLRTVEVDSVEEFRRRIGARTALVMILGNRFDDVRVSLEKVAPIARQAGVPVLVDAAADILITPNPYLAAGADLVAYSGGKILRGPQTAGLLLGREDLVRAAFANSAPHHAFGRPMKVSKEEIVGMAAAVEAWVRRRDLAAEYEEWRGWYRHIAETLSTVPGVSTKVLDPSRGGPFPTLQVAWDAERIGLTAGEVGELLRDGEPSIQTHAAGEGRSFVIRPVALKPGEYKIVAARLREVLASAPRPEKRVAATPKYDLSGRWDVRVEFARGHAEHLLFLEARDQRLVGTHVGELTRGPLEGLVEGEEARFSSVLPYEGSKLTYRFQARATGDRMEGDLDLGEYGRARWTAVRHDYSAPPPRDPSQAGKTA